MGTCGRTVIGIDSATVVQISKFLYARTIFADCVPLIWDAGGGIVARVEASAGHKGAGVVDAVEMAAFAVAGAFVGCVALYDLAAAVHAGEMGACRRTVVGSEGAAVVCISDLFHTRAVFTGSIFVVGNTRSRSVAGVETFPGNRDTGVVDTGEVLFIDRTFVECVAFIDPGGIHHVTRLRYVIANGVTGSSTRRKRGAAGIGGFPGDLYATVIRSAFQMTAVGIVGAE